ncbi:Zn(2+)-responsive transcriptional regulator [Vibrio sp. SM6]|uniref:Zn(2+)-responsive transcriptional regulator n=1 Tax=Vibrio agarilyticus TaxID=2726741 RepID=A0A7X8YHV6_9VIBR|nr:Zn(2+)-responsive transcriptional regulator [Vibrio agarilyticus]NLS13975.1 Zn(2+)-responsive transcriptional regulator [Vibrio agarilyticus]
MYRIGELAKRCGLSAEALRYYEKERLLTPSQRSASGYRLYDATHEAQVHFILKAKALGLTLEEIRELLDIKLEPNAHSCAEVKAITSAKLSLIEQKIHELTRIQQALRKINDACCGHEHSASHCSILAALDD